MMIFSVIIPTYNRRASLGQAIDSVLNTYSDQLEVIVVDDGSNDGTIAWLQQTYADQPVRVLSNQGKKGPAGARNTGIRAAQGRYLAFLDSDDLFLPHHLQQAYHAFAEHKQIDVLFGRALYQRNGETVAELANNFDRKLALAGGKQLNEQLQLFDTQFCDVLLRFGCWFNLSTVVFKRELAGSGMIEQLRVSEDYEYWVRLARQHTFACLREPQIIYQLHQDNISFEAAQRVEKHYPMRLQALELMLAYPDLSAKHIHLIRQQMSDILFSWAHACTEAGQWSDAAQLYRRSLHHGQVSRNLLALLKLPAHWLRAQLR